MHFCGILLSACILFSGTIAGIKVKLLIPKTIKSGSTVTLVCQYELDEKPLYAVKWYRGNHEFFRYIPQHTPSMRAFPFPGLQVEMAGSSAHQVTLCNVSVNISGLVICEVSTDLTFTTASDSAYLHIHGGAVHKPTLHLSSSVLKPQKNLHVNCSAQLTRPHPVISFYVDDQKVESSELEEVRPGLATFHLSLIENESTNSYNLLVKERKLGNNSKLRHIWIRCEAIVPGLYLSSSPSIPVVLSSNTETPIKKNENENDPVLKEYEINSGANSSLLSTQLYVWCLIWVLRGRDK